MEIQQACKKLIKTELVSCLEALKQNELSFSITRIDASQGTESFAFVSKCQNELAQYSADTRKLLQQEPLPAIARYFNQQLLPLMKTQFHEQISSLPDGDAQLQNTLSMWLQRDPIPLALRASLQLVQRTWAGIFAPHSSHWLKAVQSMDKKFFATLKGFPGQRDDVLQMIRGRLTVAIEIEQAQTLPTLFRYLDGYVAQEFPKKILQLYYSAWALFQQPTPGVSRSTAVKNHLLNTVDTTVQSIVDDLRTCTMSAMEYPVNERLKAIELVVHDLKQNYEDIVRYSIANVNTYISTVRGIIERLDAIPATAALTTRSFQKSSLSMKWTAPKPGFAGRPHLSTVEGNETRLVLKKLVPEKLEHELDLFKELRGCDYIVQLLNELYPQYKDYLVLECGDQNLYQQIQNPRKYDFSKYACFRHLYMAIEILHSKRIVYFSLSPSNVVWFGQNSQWKLVDFGGARAFSSNAANSIDNSPLVNVIPAYMPPEVCFFHPLLPSL